MSVADELAARDVRSTERRPGIALPGLLLGLGLGGFVDGIVLHQILQWHHMLTSTGDHPATTVAGLEVNTLWDGLFHGVTYVLVAVGVLVLWRRAREGAGVWPLRALLGWALVGWGVFDLVEGVVDHHLLGIHHVRSGPDQLAWDLGFLALGAVLVLGGALLVRGGRPAPADGARAPTPPRRR